MPNVFRFRRTSVPPEPNRNSEAVYAAADGTLKQVAPDGSETDLGGGSSPAVLVSTAYVAHADILTLPSSPIQLADAPGEGKMIVPSSALIYADTSAASYSNISEGGELGPCTTTPGDFLNFVWESSANSKISTLLGGGDPTVAALGPQAEWETVFGTGVVLPYLYSSTGLINTPLLLIAANDADYEEGDPANFLVVTVTYSILDLTAP